MTLALCTCAIILGGILYVAPDESMRVLFREAAEEGADQGSDSNHFEEGNAA